MPIGPMTLLDEVGHDVGAHVLTIMMKVFPERFSDELTKVTVEDGRLGRKNGKGFYLYTEGRRKQGVVGVRLCLIQVPEKRHSLPRGHFGKSRAESSQ